MPVEGPWTTRRQSARRARRGQARGGGAACRSARAARTRRSAGSPADDLREHGARGADRDHRPADVEPRPRHRAALRDQSQAHACFLELKTQQTYVLISGRWFRARSTDGPWEYVPDGPAPADFAKIPEGGASGVGAGLGAGHAAGARGGDCQRLPQTARSPARRRTSRPPTTARRSGGPSRARRSRMPRMRRPHHSHRRQDVLCPLQRRRFVTAAPAGAWVVAATVRRGLHHPGDLAPALRDKYVRVYGATPAVVYVGYTPAISARW